MTVRFARSLLIVLAVLALVPVGARADGDPASDVLLGENVFYPYAPPVTASLTKTLNAETAAAVKARFPLKVALIASPTDLGVIPTLFNMPQKYANFLDIEISFQGKQPLLVVMPAGFGGAGLGTAAMGALKTLAKPSGATSNDLATAAITAVGKLAAATGHPIKGVPGAGGGSSHGSGGASTAILIVLVLAAVATSGALILSRRRAPA